MTRSTHNVGLALVACALLAASACGGTATDGAASPDGATPRAIDASPCNATSTPSEPDATASPVLHPFPGAGEFVSEIDNPYLPLEPGTQWVYESISTEGDERIVVTVTDRTREIDGVTATVVRDTVTQAGEVIEDTRDWYAQDADGNVWYLGEYSESYEDGKTSTEGSWEAGKDGAKAGIVMLAHPKPGDAYQQEYYKGHAEDVGEVLGVDATASVPIGYFDTMVKTADYTPLEPDVLEQKYYAAGIGFVYEEMIRGGDDRVGLVKMTRRDGPVGPFSLCD